MRFALATLGLCLAANAAGAETLAELRQGVMGREVEISGYIGSGLDLMDAEALSFRDGEKVMYPVVFDAGREARKKLQGCKFQMYGGTPCALTGKAEIEFDGPQLRLIIFEVTTIGPPAKMPD